MNTDPKNHESAHEKEPKKGNTSSAPPKKESAWNRAKQNIAPVALALAIIFVSVYSFINIEHFTGLFSSILSVTAPILIGATIAYLLNPILKLFEYKVFKRIKNNEVVRGLSILMTYVVGILIVVGFIFLLVPQLIQSIMDFTGKYDSYLSSTANWINQTAVKLLGEKYAGLVDKDAIIRFIQNFFLTSENLMEDLVAVSGELVIGIKNVILAIFISIYILISKERLSAQSKKLATACFSKKSGKRFYRYVRLCNRTFSNFFIGMIVDSLIVGLITLIMMLILGIPYSVLIATIICITNIIPVFGPFLGAIPSFLIIFISSPTKAFIFIFLILIIQQIDGNVLAPKILGNSTGLSSLGVIISIIIMSEYFGIIGMIIGVPIFAVIVTISKELIEDRLKEKNLPTDTADYYADDSLVDPHEHHEHMATRIVKNLATIIRKIVDKIRDKIKEIKQKEHKD